jgi:hypothetical protein
MPRQRRGIGLGGQSDGNSPQPVAGPLARTPIGCDGVRLVAKRVSAFRGLGERAGNDSRLPRSPALWAPGLR